MAADRLAQIEAQAAELADRACTLPAADGRMVNRAGEPRDVVYTRIQLDLLAAASNAAYDSRRTP